MADQQQSEATRLAEEREQAHADLQEVNMVREYDDEDKPYWRVTTNTTGRLANGVKHATEQETTHPTLGDALIHVHNVGGVA